VSAVEARERRIAQIERLRRLEIAKTTGQPVWAEHEHQFAPPGDWWYLWLLLAGRGAGKTDACAVYFDRWMRQHAGARGGIVAPTLGDAFDACVYGPSGLLAHNPDIIVKSRPGGTVVVWPNKSESRLFGTHTYAEADRLRAGGNRGIFWAEELAAWKYLEDAWANMEFGLRIGVRPHVIASTTPKPRPFLKKLMEHAETVVTRASMFDNPKLPQAQRDRLRARYEGTRLARQELYGEYIEDVEGALWTYEVLAECRIDQEDMPDLTRIVVAVDPSGGDSEGNDEQGIIVAGRGVDGHGYVLADRSCKLSPDGWGKRTVHAYDEFRADRIVAETNYGGDLVVFTVRVAAESLGIEVATKKITASHGKAARAEPIAALYEQHRVHHVGPADQWEELEYQMRNWTPDSRWSPDRMDALVWAFTELMLDPTNQPIRMRTSVPRGMIVTDRFSGLGGI
jgi:phage terminase large subunit-like protein